MSEGFRLGNDVADAITQNVCRKSLVMLCVAGLCHLGRNGEHRVKKGKADSERKQVTARTYVLQIFYGND